MRSRLGDDIDDFCVKCKRVMNHLVVSLLGDEPAKVRCRTCHNDHDFRHEQAPPPRVDSRKAALIQQALEKAAVATGNGAAVETAAVETVAVEAAAVETGVVETEEQAPAEVAAPVVESVLAAKPARKTAKAK
ncbi:MAG TPA: hypothetical protein VGM43_11530 [Bryobacteraceae bacterium]|jgi:hypothetical protein